MFAGVYIHAIAVAADAADGDIFHHDVFAVGRVDRPHALLLRGKTFEANILAFNRFDDAWPSRHLAIAERQVTGNRPRTTMAMWFA